MGKLTDLRRRKAPPETPLLPRQASDQTSGQAKLSRRVLLALIPAFVGVSLAACGPGTSASQPTPTPDDAEQEPRGLGPDPESPTPQTVPQPSPTTAAVPRATPTAPALRPLLDQPVVLAHGEHRWTAAPSDLGIGELASLPSSSGELALDETRLTTYLRTLAREVDRVPVEARLSVSSDLKVSVFLAKSGLRVDLAGTAERVRSAVLVRVGSATAPETIEVELAVEEVSPKTVESDLASARSALEKALGSPLTLRLGDRSWQLSPRELAQALTVSPPDGDGQTWRVEVADEPFKSLLEEIAPEVVKAPLDARLDWNGGKLKTIRESKDGRRLDVEATLAQIKAKVVTDQRAIDLVLAPVAPTVDHRRIDQLGIKELIESATTSYTTAVPEKKYNINLAASRLNGVVVPPGGTFSFNKEVGPTTLKAGFKWGYGIQRTDSGVTTVPSVGGGICQVATTLFQAVFWGGYQIDTRRSHSYWIPAYTSRGIVGLDTTVDEPSGLDLRFTNTTPNFLLVRARTEGSSVIFSLYGKKPGWKVEVGKATIANVTPALTERTVEENPNLEYGKEIQVQVAREGFDASVVRRVHESGHVGNVEGGSGNLRTLSVKNHYEPTGTVVAVGTKGKPQSAR